MISSQPESGRIQRGSRFPFPIPVLLRWMMHAVCEVCRAWATFRDSTPPLSAAPQPIPGPIGGHEIALRALCRRCPPHESRTAMPGAAEEPNLNPADAAYLCEEDTW